MTDGSSPLPPPDPPASTPDSLQEDLKRSVRALLPTQQQLIDLRSRRDSEQNVLESIIHLGERILPTTSENAFWGPVADAAVEAFEYESCLIVELRVDGSTILAARGPRPMDAAEAEMLDCALRRFLKQRVSFISDPDLPPLRFAGGAVASLMLAPISDGVPESLPVHLLLAAVTQRKRPFFPYFDKQALPGHRLFASHVHVLLEMIESRRRTAASEQRYRKLFEDSVQAQAEKERLQVQLAQAQRMESIGRLAGGIAHDFNNLLMVISGNIEMLQHEAKLSPAQRDHLTEVLGASRRAQELTQQLLMLSRKQVIKPSQIDMNRQIEDSLRIYRRLLGEDIALQFRPCLEDTPIMADRQQVDQVLLNLLLNARDAIHAVEHTEGERLIEVSTQVVREGSPLFDDTPAVLLIVRDTGAGMDEAVRANIFEPFFTTKDDRKGTGLGLSTVLGVIQQNEGTIDVVSAPGKGAEFRIHWPMRVAEPAVASAPVPVRAQASGETILLVEDDSQVRNLMVLGLQKQGYKVAAFEHGGMALTALDEGRVQPDLLVSDVVMPHMNGKDLADQVRARIPHLPILFVSGYTDDIIAENGIVAEGIALLSKPFNTNGLGKRIRELLDSRGA